MESRGRVDAAAADLVESGRLALARGAFEEARTCFEAAVAEEATARALEGLSWAAWWLNDAPAMFDSRERSYRRYRQAGDRLGAARMAMWLGTDHADFRGELAVAAGWLARARRLLEGLEPGAEHGWLWVHEAEKLLYAHDTAGARALGAAAADLGRQLGLTDLEMMGLATEGLALVTEGAVREGLRRIDEAAAEALAEEFDDLFPPVWCCCYQIFACERLRDLDRAAQWCRRFEEWSERMRVPFANRLCRAHYAGILVRRGSWQSAEAELRECAEVLGEIRPPFSAEATVRLGELRRRQGRLDDALEIFGGVAEHPLALLGMGEVLLDRGDAAGARDRAEEYLRAIPREALALRIPGLELLVRATELPAGEAAAVAALEELEAAASALASDPVRASANLAAGKLASAQGQREQARKAFEDALRFFQRSGTPFEVACVRLELAAVLEALGRHDPARLEIETALDAFQRLGATGHAKRAETILGRMRAKNESARTATGPLGTLSHRELEVLALLAEGLSNPEIAERLVISEHTVHRHVANILRKLGLSSRTAAAALAGRHGLGTSLPR